MDYITETISALSEAERDDLARNARRFVEDADDYRDAAVWSAVADVARGWADARDVTSAVAGLGAEQRRALAVAMCRSRNDFVDAGEDGLAAVFNALMCAAEEATDEERALIREWNPDVAEFTG